MKNKVHDIDLDKEKLNDIINILMKDENLKVEVKDKNGNWIEWIKD